MTSFLHENCVVFYASASIEAGPLFRAMNDTLVHISATISNCLGQHYGRGVSMNGKWSGFQAGLKSEGCRLDFAPCAVSFFSLGL